MPKLHKKVDKTFVICLYITVKIKAVAMQCIQNNFHKGFSLNLLR